VRGVLMGPKTFRLNLCRPNRPYTCFDIYAAIEVCLCEALMDGGAPVEGVALMT